MITPLIGCYLSACCLHQYTRLGLLSSRYTQYLATPLILIALVLHGMLLHHWIDIGGVQNLTALNLCSLMLWLMSVIVLALSIRYPLGNLISVVLPMAALSVLLAALFPGYYLMDMHGNLYALVHILLGVLTVSVVSIAGLQAVYLAFQERRLQQKALMGAGVGSPLETTEQCLFRLVGVGFFLLTLMLLSSLYFFAEGIFLPAMRHKTILGVMAWGLFAVLLWGRYYYGWRGLKAVYYTMMGTSVLMVTYLASALLQGGQ